MCCFLGSAKLRQRHPNLCRPRYLIFTTFSQVVKIVSRRVLSESFVARSTFKAGQAL